MLYFIFHFSYAKQMIINDFKENELIYGDYIISFLTKKNFNNLFEKKYLLLKNILIGKYFLFYKINNNTNNIEKELNKLINLFKQNNIIVNLLCIIYNNKIIFNNFLNESKKYFNFKIFNNLIKLLNILKLFNINIYNIYIFYYILIKILIIRIIDFFNNDMFVNY